MSCSVVSYSFIPLAAVLEQEIDVCDGSLSLPSPLSPERGFKKKKKMQQKKKISTMIECTNATTEALMTQLTILTRIGTVVDESSRELSQVSKNVFDSSFLLWILITV